MDLLVVHITCATNLLWVRGLYEKFISLFGQKTPTAFFKYMKYEEIFSVSNLYKAHMKTRKGKLHKREVAEFELNKAYEIYKLYEELRKHKYQISPYRTFYVLEPKKRRVDATTYRDRVVQACFVDNYLRPLLERKLIYDNAACRKDKGTDFARRRLKEFLVDAYKKYGLEFYVYSFDIHHYFEMINHDSLKDKLRKIIDDDEMLQFAYMIIDSFCIEEGIGLPLGNQTSQCFALYYLDNVDRIIKERYSIKYYSRYMDDGVIISNDKEILVDLSKTLKSAMKELKLEFNEKKNQIFKIKQGVTYLGFTYHLAKNGKIISKMARGKKKRLIRHIRKHDLNIDSLVSYKNYLDMRSNNRKLIGYIKRKIMLAKIGQACDVG